jgi:hypothetical protein
MKIHSSVLKQLATCSKKEMAKLISTFLQLFVANMPKWFYRKGLHQFLQREEKVNDTKANTAQNSN